MVRYLAVIGLLNFTVNASGQVILNSPSGLANPQVTITFTEHVFPQQTVLTNQYNDLGVNFSPRLYYSPETTAHGNVDSSNLGNYDNTNFPASRVDPISLQFNTPVIAADFAFITNAGSPGAMEQTSFTALMNGVVVSSSGFVSTDLTGGYYGFQNVVFNEISVNVQILTDESGLANGGLRLDNFQYSAVPEPSALLLTAAAGGALAALRRRFAGGKKTAAH